MASKPPPVPPRPPGGFGARPIGRPLPPTPVQRAQMVPPPVPPMPQGLIGTINAAAAIESVAELGGGGMNPIWLVTMKSAAAKIVLKQEKQFLDGNYNKVTPGVARANVRAMNQVMTTVSPSAAMDAVSPRELDALAQFAGTPKSLKDKLPQIRAGALVLIKMKYDSSFASHSNKGVQDGSSAMSPKDEDNARKFLEALRGNRKAWQSLGQVTIADALIGNNDRVDITNGGVTNFGNLIFARATDGTFTKALGYDTIDPASMVEKVMFGTNISDWVTNFGSKIKDKTRFINFAQGVVKELNQRRMVPLGLQPFGHAEQAAFAEGMVIGWDKLANRIGATVRQGKGIPSGLMARAKYLGWVK